MIPLRGGSSKFHGRAVHSEVLAVSNFSITVDSHYILSLFKAKYIHQHQGRIIQLPQKDRSAQTVLSLLGDEGLTSNRASCSKSEEAGVIWGNESLVPAEKADYQT